MTIYIVYTEFNNGNNADTLFQTVCMHHDTNLSFGFRNGSSWYFDIYLVEKSGVKKYDVRASELAIVINLIRRDYLLIFVKACFSYCRSSLVWYRSIALALACASLASWFLSELRL